MTIMNCREDDGSLIKTENNFFYRWWAASLMNAERFTCELCMQNFCELNRTKNLKSWLIKPAIRRLIDWADILKWEFLLFKRREFIFFLGSHGYCSRRREVWLQSEVQFPVVFDIADVRSASFWFTKQFRRETFCRSQLAYSNGL